MALTWTNRPNPFNGDTSEVATGCAWASSLGLFAATGQDAAGLISIITSSDGVVWNAETTPFDGVAFPAGIAWSETLGMFVAVSNGASPLITSVDGSTWITQTTPYDGVGSLEGVAWSEDALMFVAVGSDGTEAILTSTDGTTWVSQASPFDGNTAYAVTWVSFLSLWIAAGDTGTGCVCTSPDGVVWTQQTTPADGFTGQGVGFSSSFAFVGSNDGSNALMSSPDGAVWTTVTSGLDAGGKAVVDAGGNILAVGDVLSGSPIDLSVNGVTWVSSSSPFDDLGSTSVNDVCYSPALSLAVAVGQGPSLAGALVTIATAPVTPLSPPSNVVPPLWRNFVADLAGQGITDYSKLTSDRAVEVILNGPLSAEGTVPSDNPQVWIPYTDDGYDDPYLSEGTRLMWWFRKESNTPPYYTVRGATIVQLVADEAQQDDARTRFVGWDPWHYMFSRPVQTFTGDLPGDAGISFTATQAATVIESLLDNTFQNDGHIYIDLPDLKPDLTVNSGASGFWNGTIETGAGMEIDINFAQNTSVGQALQQVCNMGVCDIILNPIYDPTDRPNFLVELNVYAQAGVTRDEAIFAWNAPGRSLVGLSRTEDGSSRANKMVFFAGQGGASGITAVTQDAASQAKYGVYFAQQFFPGQVDLNAVSDLVDQQLALRKNGKTTVMIRPAPERSPRPWQDYQLGDRVPTWALRQGFRKLLG